MVIFVESPLVLVVRVRPFGVDPIIPFLVEEKLSVVNNSPRV
jgi:hypothetical protein